MSLNTKRILPSFTRIAAATIFRQPPQKYGQIYLTCITDTVQQIRHCSSSKPTPRQIELMARSLPKRAPLPGVANIIVVASGKGGVGKSTTSTNLAVTLAQMGFKTGLLDADVFGPSIPLMMNLGSMEPFVNDQNLMIPPINFGVKCLSMGLLVDANKPIVWRGPLVMSALQRLLKGAVWAPLDILIVDTPPGTGDIHLSLTQNVPVSGVLLVSTPQAAALDVTRRGAEMYRTLGVPLVGIVENMRHAWCENCHSKVDIYDGTGTEALAKQLGIHLLESIAIVPQVARSCDAGRPLVAQEQDSEYAAAFRRIANGILEFLDIQKVTKTN